MEKMLSEKTCEILFKQRRVKVKDLKDGQTIFTFVDGKLFSGDVARCEGENCPNVGLVNGGEVDGALTSEVDLIASGRAFALSATLIREEIGCYDADGSGKVLCDLCRIKREAARKE